MQIVLLWTKQRCWRTSFVTSRRNLIQPLGFFGKKRSSLIPRIQLLCLIMQRSWRQLERSKPFLFFYILIVSQLSPEVFQYLVLFFVFGEHLVWCWWIFHRVELYALFVLNLVHLHFNDLWYIYWSYVMSLQGWLVIGISKDPVYYRRRNKRYSRCSNIFFAIAGNKNQVFVFSFLFQGLV